MPASSNHSWRDNGCLPFGEKFRNSRKKSNCSAVSRNFGVYLQRYPLSSRSEREVTKLRTIFSHFLLPVSCPVSNMVAAAVSSCKTVSRSLEMLELLNHKCVGTVASKCPVNLFVGFEKNSRVNQSVFESHLIASFATFPAKANSYEICWYFQPPNSHILLNIQISTSLIRHLPGRSWRRRSW